MPPATATPRPVAACPGAGPCSSSPSTRPTCGSSRAARPAVAPGGHLAADARRRPGALLWKSRHWSTGPPGREFARSTTIFTDRCPHGAWRSRTSLSSWRGRGCCLPVWSVLPDHPRSHAIAAWSTVGGPTRHPHATAWL